MVKVTYIDSSDTARTVDVDVGVSVMKGAKLNDIPEIESECGGECTCSTCHVYVDPEWLDRTGSPSKIELGLLALNSMRKPNSRLSCQIKMTESLEGLVVHTLPPEEDA